MKIVCLGDSCTYGQNVRADEAWPAVLASLTGHDVRNAGVCGDTTRLGLERWKYAVWLHDPDVVVLQFGHNDANEWDGTPRVSRRAYMSNIDEMVARARRAIVLKPHHAPGREYEYNERVSDYAASIRGLDPPAVTVLDDGYGVHPDQAMHQRYAETVAAWL